MEISRIVRKWAKKNGLKQATTVLTRELNEANELDFDGYYERAEERRKAQETKSRERLITIFLTLTASMTYKDNERYKQQQYLIREIKKIIEETKP